MPIKRNVTLREEDHVYLDEYGTMYKSMTTLVNSHKKPFDIEYWAAKKAAEWNMTKEDVIKMWNDNRDLACEKGTKVHKHLEDGGNAIKDVNRNISSITGNLKLNYIMENFPDIAKDIQADIDNGYKIYTEKIVYLYEYLVAGCIDYLAVKGNLFKIRDWKTNKHDLYFEGGYWSNKLNKYVYTNNTLLYPLDNLPECNGTTYSLQLSGYSFMMEQWGFKNESLDLYHIRGAFNDSGGFNVDDLKKHPVNYLLKDTIKMFNFYKYNRNATTRNSKAISF